MSADIFSRREREGRIREAISGLVTTQALLDVFAADTFASPGPILPGLGQVETSGVRKRFDAFCAKVAVALRNAGLCEPCPNNGFHGIGILNQWDQFVRGEIDADAEGMNMTPLFRVMAGVAHGLAHVYHNGPRDANARDDYARDVRRRLTEVLASEDDIHMISIRIVSKLDQDLYLEIAESFLKPVIHLIPDGDIGDGAPLPIAPEPRHARHLSLSVPSRRLAVVSWLDVPGFEEGLKALMGGDIPQSGTPGRTDRKARAFYEQAGIILIHVGNMDPHVSIEAPGVWRAGHIDDEHLDPSQIPEFAWSASGPSHLMADVEVFVDVLMSSGLYLGREDASAALSLAEEGEDITIIELDAETFHVYGPTGYGWTQASFTEKVRVEGFGYPEWRSDAYLVSTSELPIFPETLEVHDWAEGRVDPDISRRSEKDACPDL